MTFVVIASIFGLLCLLANLISGFALNDNAEIQLLKREIEMLHILNRSVDPCENFYEFACGKWRNLYPETSYYTQISDAFDENVLEMLKNERDPKDSEFDNKVKNFYQSCVSLRNDVDSESILKITEEFGKMPVLMANDEEWDEKAFDWLDMLARIKKKYGFEIIIGLYIGIDLRDKSTNRVYIGQAELKFKSKSVYLEPMGEPYLESYKQDIAMEMEKLLNIEETKAAKLASEIVNFEVQLAKGMMESEADRSIEKILLETTAEELQLKYRPTIDVKRLFQIIFGEVPEGMIYENVPGYLQNVKEVIEKSKKRDVANYIFYQLLQKFTIDDSETMLNLEENCLAVVKKQFYKAIDNMFYRRFGNEEVENGIKDLWYKIKSTFKAKLQDVEDADWISDETRLRALEKLEALKLKINTYEDYDFGEDFDNVAMSVNDFVGNLQNIKRLDSQKALSKLYEPVPKIGPRCKYSVTPIYLQAENTVYLPVAMLQPNFLWASNFPDVLKYSLTGFVLAHELIHAFDDTGRQFGKTGNLEDWWDSESTKRFLERRTCLIDQYQSYFTAKKRLPKSEIQSENIADNGGLKLAYDAFIAHVFSSNNDDSQIFRDLKFPKRQLFFIAYGQLWCDDTPELLIDLQMAADKLSPGRFRSIGTVSNSVEFAKVFNCTVDSKMNPKKKCKVY